jgi:hypothetical protein
LKLQVGNIKNKKNRKSGLTDLFDSPKQKRLSGSDRHDSDSVSVSENYLCPVEIQFTLPFFLYRLIDFKMGKFHF